MSFNGRVLIAAAGYPFGPKSTYYNNQIYGLNKAGLDVHVISPKGYGYETVPDDAIEGVDCTFVAAPDYMSHEEALMMIDAIDKYDVDPTAFEQLLLKVGYERPSSQLLLRAVQNIRGTDAYNEARAEFQIDLEYAESPRRKQGRPGLFIRALATAQYALENDIQVIDGLSFADNATVAMYAATLAGDGVCWGTKGHRSDTDILPDQEVYKKKLRAAYVASEAPVASREMCRIYPDEIRQQMIEAIPVVPRGIRTDIFCEPEDPRSYQDGDVLELVSISRAIAKKGVDDTLRAVAALPHRNWRFTFVGDGEQLEEWQALAIELGIQDNVVFTGGLPHAEILPYLQRAHLLMLTCHEQENPLLKFEQSDGIPTVIYEAAATKLPVVATDIGGVRDYITHGQNGLVVPQRDIAAIADAI